MKKSALLLYGIINYLLGSGALVYLIAFLFNLIPTVAVFNGIDGNENGDLVSAILINIGLIGLFGFQHSVMARPEFKSWLETYIPKAAERSTYMLATAIVTFALCVGWQSMTDVVWMAESTLAYNVLLGIGLAGWALVLYATFLINHFDLFGLRQVWLHFTGKEYTSIPFQQKSLYKVVRHPIMTGAFIGIWFTPVMTTGHLLFAVGMSIYILIGVYHEERDLIRAFGDRYLNYANNTAKFFPGFRTHNDPKLVNENL